MDMNFGNLNLGIYIGYSHEKA